MYASTQSSKTGTLVPAQSALQMPLGVVKAPGKIAPLGTPQHPGGNRVAESVEFALKCAKFFEKFHGAARP
jgi:hypothetical protein